MGAHDGAVEHLHQMRRRRQSGEVIEKGLAHTRLAQPVEALPHAVPFAEPLGQCSPCDVVNREIVQRFQEQPVVPALSPRGGSETRNTSNAKDQSASTIFVDVADLQISRLPMNQTKRITGIDQLDHAVKIAGALARGEEGCLRIGLHMPPLAGFLPDMLALHHERHPRIGIEVTEGRSADIMQLLRQGQLDIAFVIGLPKAEDCHSRLLWSEALMAALPANHPLAERPAITWADFTAETFLIRCGGCRRPGRGLGSK